MLPFKQTNKNQWGNFVAPGTDLLWEDLTGMYGSPWVLIFFHKAAVVCST